MTAALWFAIGIIIGGALGYFAYKIQATIIIGVQMLQRIAKIREETKQGIAQTLQPIEIIRQGSQGRETSQVVKTPTPQQIKERQRLEFARKNNL